VKYTSELNLNVILSMMLSGRKFEFASLGRRDGPVDPHCTWHGVIANFREKNKEFTIIFCT
jgi:hypothetical protein